MSDEPTVELVYDGSCPVCSAYSSSVDIDERKGRLERIDARKPGGLVDLITDAGIDLDEGLVVRIDGELYAGAQAVHRLAELSSNEGVLNRLMAAAFRSRRRTEILYPVLRAARNLLLKLLGRERIDNLGNDERR